MHKFNPERRYSPESVYMKTLYRRAKEEYGLGNENTFWTDEEKGRLLDGYLFGELFYLGPPPCLAGELHRSPHAVFTMLWKLAANYRHGEAVQCVGDAYSGAGRFGREGTPFTSRDYYLAGLAHGDRGRENGAYEPARLGKILARTAAEVAAWQCDLVGVGKRQLSLRKTPPTLGLFAPPPEPQEYELILLAVAVRLRGIDPLGGHDPRLGTL